MGNCLKSIPIAMFLLSNSHVLASHGARATLSQPLPAPASSLSSPAVRPVMLSQAQVSHAINDLRSRQLMLPIHGISAEQLKGSFYEMRGDTRHEATDILAARNTPVYAIEDGVIGKLFLSKFGGNTIYQIDPTGKYVYYYAHLERYEPSLKEGDRVRQGQVIGFVGTSGNAPPNTPHLHFCISIMTPEKKWWQAQAIDPYEVFQHKQTRSGGKN